MESSRRRGFIACSTGNYTSGRQGVTVDTIVVHYTGTSASAYNNCVYFSRPGAGASAHYFVDKDGAYYQSVHEYDTAWHAGDWGMNLRSIGIEVVSAGEEYTQAQKETLRYLVRGIMARRGIKASRVIRHYDVTGKLCPAAYCGTSAKDEKWKSLRSYITKAASRKKLLQCSENGFWGTKTTKVWQAINGIAETGMVYRQLPGSKPHLKACTSSRFANHSFIFADSDKAAKTGSLAIKRLQNRKLGIPWSECTGWMDAKTRKLFVAKYYGKGYTTTDLLAPSKAVKAFQREINREAKKLGIKR